MKKSFEWNAKNYYTANELNSFLKNVKKDLIGQTIDKIMVMGHIYTSDGIDEQGNRCIKYADENDWTRENAKTNTLSNPTHGVSLRLDEPLVLCFGNIHFEINYCEFSNAQVALNTLDFTEMSNVEGCVAWQNVSTYYSKNVIGQKLSDIKINCTPKPNECVSHYRKIGENMYDEIIFVFENGYQLEISSDIDYMNLYENSIWIQQQKSALRDWKIYNDDKSFLKDEELMPKELIEKSSPVNGENVKITANEVWLFDLIDYEFIINNNDNISYCYYGFAENNMNDLWYFLESLTQTNEDLYFSCEEEGPTSFFYIHNLDNEKIRFIHISNRVQKPVQIINGLFQIHQDFIISKYQFIKQFYDAIRQPIINTRIEDLDNSLGIEEFEQLKKDSIIIKKYLDKWKDK